MQHRVIARLKDGVSIEQAQSAVDRISAETRKNFLISGTAGYAIRLEPMHAHVVEEVRPALLALMGAVVFLLLIACANVANLMLVRASLRERELAVRTAHGRQPLGAGSPDARRSRSCSPSSARRLGLALAYAGISELRSLAPPTLPRLDTIAIDPMVIAFTAVAALVRRGDSSASCPHCAPRAPISPSCCAAAAAPPDWARRHVAQRGGGR